MCSTIYQLEIILPCREEKSRGKKYYLKSLPSLFQRSCVTWCPSCTREISYTSKLGTVQFLTQNKNEKKISKKLFSDYNLHCSNKLSVTKISLSLGICNCPNL